MNTKKFLLQFLLFQFNFKNFYINIPNRPERTTRLPDNGRMRYGDPSTFEREAIKELDPCLFSGKNSSIPELFAGKTSRLILHARIPYKTSI